jgi:hypothetical protein
MPTRPSCGYAPLQRFTVGLRIALLVRRSRFAYRGSRRDTRSHGIPSDQPVARPKPCNSSPAVAPTAGFNPNTARQLVRASTTPRGDFSVLPPPREVISACLVHPEGRPKRFSCRPERQPEGAPALQRFHESVPELPRRATETCVHDPEGLLQRDSTAPKGR